MTYIWIKSLQITQQFKSLEILRKQVLMNVKPFTRTIMKLQLSYPQCFPFHRYIPATLTVHLLLQAPVYKLWVFRALLTSTVPCPPALSLQKSPQCSPKPMTSLGVATSKTQPYGTKPLKIIRDSLLFYIVWYVSHLNLSCPASHGYYR